ncbi:sigma-70 family RNA polymerase sigma factor [Hymenobacter lutimineralis]|uniref:Sigma-70 family RNA polymerase sigma factor n=1 Tax=Hymenobacter lutimineralis TaxID=2606448 RepID=A0A5D6UVF3_9BACT|nr:MULTISPECIES: sigma-70 family RNA polymerase sigma factor [Hymenobacter]QIX62068.1 sigma-70 family RNA polymerase sigma factor [Hymenobacter sp. BT18]TYZ07030.1 sigma-70 family RNA polymerase sigma factor [Hymenobacter lutimineralis]
METMQPSDSALISLYISGQEDAFALLLERHKSRVFTTIMLIVRDTDVADDLLQDTFIKAVHTMKSGRYNEEGKFSSWICRIAHNLAIDFFRREKRSPLQNLDTTSHTFNSLSLAEEGAEAALTREETYAQLRELIQDLPPAQKEVLIMRHYGDMSFQEIADATGVSINTALGRMRYALINLRKKMSAQPVFYDQNLYPRETPPVRVQRIAG